MNPLEDDDLNLDSLFLHYIERAGRETMNMVRVKRFYDDEKSFNVLMNRLIDNDSKRFERLMKQDSMFLHPKPWRVFYVILDIVQHEGEEVEPYDVLTRSFPSRTLVYMGWTFSWVHGENTLISVYNREDELIYRF